MAISLIRSILLYFSVVVLYRVMGKRQIGEMQPGELVLAIMIADIAAVPLQSTGTPLTAGLVPVIGLMCVEIVVAFIAQKSNGLRKVITGKPSLVIADGRLVVEEMERLRFNIDDLFEQLRMSGYFDVSEIAFAVLETNGNLSVLPREQSNTFPSNIIKDGEIDHEALKEIGKNKKWLTSELKKLGIQSVSQVFLLCADKHRVTFLQKKEQKR